MLPGILIRPSVCGGAARQGASTFDRMRSPLALAVAVVALAAPASARANEVRLWACHGPDGRAVPASYDVQRSAGAFVTPTSSVPCATPGDTIRLGFTTPGPPEGSFAVLRLNAPAGVQLVGVWLVRRATGPGYFARTSTTDLEAENAGATLDGVFAHAATGAWVELGLRCASAGCDMTGAALDFHSAALVVRDGSSPSFSVSALPASAAGVTALTVDARDTGLGLASASATLGGVPLATSALGGSACAELSPGDPTVDLPLADDCPATRRVVLGIDTTQVPDGTHRLEVTVTDGAGNAAVQGSDLKVVNDPPAAPTPVPTATPAPVPATAVLGPLGRYTRGAVAVEASCPARAAASCTVALTLRAKLPPSRRTATIARARASVRPGAKAKVTLTLSAAARRALAKRRSLRATLTLGAATPVAVTVRRG
jgi:hypothetical protein